MKNIVIVGAGDLGKEVVWLIEDINKEEPTYLIMGFLDDNPSKKGQEFYGYKILGGTDLLKSLSEKVPLYAVVAIQDGSIRRKIVEAHPEFTRWESIIHPMAVIASSSTVGCGSIFFPHTTVSVDTNAGKFGLYYINSTVCNDCRIGDYVSVMSGALVSERSIVGDGCQISAGHIVDPHKQVTKHRV